MNKMYDIIFDDKNGCLNTKANGAQESYGIQKSDNFSFITRPQLQNMDSLIKKGFSGASTFAALNAAACFLERRQIKPGLKGPGRNRITYEFLFQAGAGKRV